MKLTWFGDTAIRIYIGGQIFVVDPQLAPGGVDQAELAAGAEKVLRLAGGDGAETIDPRNWRPQKAPRMIDEGEGLPPVRLYRIGLSALLIDAVGEAPLMLAGHDDLEFGRWADGAVVVLFGAGQAAAKLLDAARPKLIALAGGEEAVDATVGAIRDRLDGAGLVAMEPGLAVEV
ncbi:hypothetical protein VE25_00830 [Devosia geojensis]|uniref:Uncharacterized protein n=1 Tax=Devosia geojensis TaxID=443610 RepID=A0A0F5FXT6_9HYPH|nr:hypothetical protein [Devosia geojensis]KKB13664.1 hypothetical protein VE25_00830 [Devosia geojensis]